MDWNEVKEKPKKHKKPQKDESGGQFGGQHGNRLFAGAIKQTNTGPAKTATNNQASAIADFDYLRDDDDEEIKYERVTLDCAKAVQAARLKKEWS